MGYSEARMIGKTEARMRAMGKQDFFVPPAVGSPPISVRRKCKQCKRLKRVDLG